MAILDDNWAIRLDRFDGWHTSLDSDKIPFGRTPDILNARITGAHFRGSGGYKIAGTRNSTAGEITSQWTYRRIDGKERMLRVTDDASTGTMQWYDATNKDWYTLLASLTTGKIMADASFNTSTTNQMIVCNGVQNISVWTGSTTTLTAAVTGGPSSIAVVSTADFPSSGTIIYNATEVTYTSKTATTFVKSSGTFHDSAGADDGVAQAIDDSTHSGITKGNILLSAKDRLWIAGQPSAPNALDYSDEGDAFTYTGGSNRADSGTEDFYGLGGAITGLAEKGEEIIVLGEDGADGFSFTYPTSTTKAPNFRESFRGQDKGCSFSKSVFKVNNQIYFANKNGIAALTDLEGSTDKVFTKSITREILPNTRNYVFAESSAQFFEKESILVMSCKSNKDFTANDIIIGVEFYTNQDGTDIIGLTRFDWPANDWAVLDNELYFGSSLEQNSFTAFDTNQNDEAPRNIRYATKRFDFEDPFQWKGTRMAAVRGFIKDGTDIKVEVLYNAGFLGTDNKTITSNGAYVSSSTLNFIGAFQMGTNPIGATIGEVSDLKRFLVYLDLGVDYVYSDIQFIFKSDTDGGTFIIDYLGLMVNKEGFANQDQLTI